MNTTPGLKLDLLEPGLIVTDHFNFGTFLVFSSEELTKLQEINRNVSFSEELFSKYYSSLLIQIVRLLGLIPEIFFGLPLESLHNIFDEIDCVLINLNRRLPFSDEQEEKFPLFAELSQTLFTE